MRVSRRGVAGLLVALAAVAGCSGQANITGSWTPVSTSGEGAPASLPGVELNVMGKELTGNDGCGLIRATVEVVDSELAVTDWQGPETQCRGEAGAVAGFVRRVLTARPSVSRDGGLLTLNGGGATLELQLN